MKLSWGGNDESENTKGFLLRVSVCYREEMASVETWGQLKQGDRLKTEY